MNKKELREKYTAIRSRLSPQEVEDMSLAIANRVLALPIWEYIFYHIFLPITGKNEVDTHFLLHILQGRGKSIVVPKANFGDGSMQHYLLQENTPLKTSAYGIPEPVSGIEISPSRIEVVFVPLLAFDKMGNRLGYGKGFYDRFLALCKPDSIFIGLSFFEAEELIDASEQDIPLHYCITPKSTNTFASIQRGL